MDPPRSHTWCFEIISDAYRSDRKHITGRHSAGEGFFDAFAKYAHPAKVLLVNDSPDIFNQFADKFSQRQSVLSVEQNDIEALLAADIFFQSTPLICKHAWLRRYAADSAFSLCGITHSVATERVILGIQEYLTAPLHDWDALVCTSKAAKAAVTRILREQEEYLNERGFRGAGCKVHMPVIPLGVDTAKYALNTSKKILRKEFRQAKGIAENDVVGMYLGRMDCLSKAHPTPLFLAMELAQKQSAGTKLHLLMAGQFQNRQTEDDFKNAARAFAPSVDVYWIDGQNFSQFESAWAAGDFFLSLSDNIQESYGLTVVEAMSAGLPVIASDWDGYRDTVMDNHTGFLVRTTCPPKHTGDGLAKGLALQSIDYSAYLGALSQFTAIDVRQCGNAITALAKDANLRAAMSQNAVKRAREYYDWQHIIQQYEKLAEELTSRRTHHEAHSRGKITRSANPAYPNPLSIFSEHPTDSLDENMVITVASADFAGHINLLLGFQIHSFGQPLMLDIENMIIMLEALKTSPASVGELLLAYPKNDQVKTLNSLMWLYKFGIIEVG